MNQSEIMEISSAFQQAWEEYFGCPMEYVPFKPAQVDDVYDEVAIRGYDETEVVPFIGSIKDKEKQDMQTPVGLDERNILTITLITQTLIDAGLTDIDKAALIRYTDAYGKLWRFKIIDDFQKVQLNAFKVFTKIDVVEML